MKKKITVLIVLLLAVMFAVTGCTNIAKNGETDTAQNSSTAEQIKKMGLGINLGNTFEATGLAQFPPNDLKNTDSWINGTLEAHETAWGSPVITKQIIQGYKNAGFSTLRIPVAWSNLMNMSNYTINPGLLNRVQQIVDWTLEADMYAIVNLHWDGGWIKHFPDQYDECMKRYKRIWEQVSARFKDYNENLLFESQNEELGFDSIWNPWSGNSSQKAKSYQIVNAINQTFVDVVRASGGINASRHLIIAGYNTNIDRTCDPLFKMPTDPANRMAVKVHYYDPFGFTHLMDDESWAKATWTWGSQTERNHLNTEMNKMKRNFIDKRIPVVIGEYGVCKQEIEQSEINKYTLAVTEAMYSRGMLPMLWDVQLNEDKEDLFYFDRHKPGMKDADLEAGMRKIAASRK